MSNPDDGGPYHPEQFAQRNGDGDIYYNTVRGCSVRAEFAKTFAAAWLPIVVAQKTAGIDMMTANELGLAMADDLLRRLREST